MATISRELKATDHGDGVLRMGSNGKRRKYPVNSSVPAVAPVQRRNRIIERWVFKEHTLKIIFLAF